LSSNSYSLLCLFTFQLPVFGTVFVCKNRVVLHMSAYKISCSSNGGYQLSVFANANP
jgi:hypothetical protein